jgi:hypothetical protein
VRSFGLEIADLVDGGGLGLREMTTLAIGASRIGRRQGMRGGQATRFHQVEQGAGLGMQHGSRSLVFERISLS